MATSADSPFIGAENKPELIRCAVLFFDLLAVSAMAQGNAAEEELVSFNRTIREALPYPIGNAAVAQGQSAYPASVFSDSVVAAVPVESGLPSAQAIFQLIFDAARLQADLAIRNYFARGAITFDRFHFHDGLIFGPALVEAVELERSVARDPRIIISPAATESLQAARLHGDPFGAAAAKLVLVDEDGLPFIDYLGGTFDADTVVDLTQRLGRHRDFVTKRLENHETRFQRWSKHRWVAEYHNAICRRYKEELADHGGYEGFLVKRVHTGGEFRELPAPGGRAGDVRPRPRWRRGARFGRR